MIKYLQDHWDSLHKIDPSATLTGAIILALIVAGGRFAYSLSRWIFGKLARILYPLLSGAFLVDRFWSLPKYRNSLYGRISEIAHPWLAKKQCLTDIYVPVSATAKLGSSKPLELGALVRQFRRVVIIGDPGSGKTTGLKAIALRVLRLEISDEPGRWLVPTFINLRQLAEEKSTIDDFVLKQFAELQFPNANRAVCRLIRKGRLVYLLDGLDEVAASDRPGVIEQIRALIQRHNDQKTPCRLLLTSRPVGYDGQLDGFVDSTVKMADFTPADIRQFVRNWEFEPPRSHEELLNSIFTRPPILLIAQNPLMLTIITFLYGYTQYELPKSRGEFYKICSDALLRNWDAAKNIGDRNKFSAAQKTAFLKKFAFQVLEQGKLDFDEPYLMEKIEAYRNERKMAEGTAAELFFELRRSGLLASLPTGDMFFAHKTLAESLASRYLRGKVEQLSSLWRTKPSAWLEVCSLYVSDPECSNGEIARLIEDARLTGNICGEVALAGEAHTCPEAQSRCLKERLAAVPALWTELDQRAVNALSALGGSADQILTEMLDADLDEVRARALRALGLVREPWATKLIIGALSSEATRTAATSALIAFGRDAVPIIRAVFYSDICKGDTVLAGIVVLEGVSGVEAFEGILPILYSPLSGLAIEAALACGRLLRDPTLRREFESRPVARFERAPSSKVVDTADMEGKLALVRMLPWLKSVDTEHGRIYLKIIVLVEYHMEYSRLQLDSQGLYEANPVAARLLIPICLRAKIWEHPFAFSASSMTNNEKAACARVRQVYDILKQLRTDQSSVWSRVEVECKPDIKLSQKTAGILGAAIALLFAALIADGILSKQMSYIYAVPLLLIFFFGALGFIAERDSKTFSLIPILIGFPLTVVRHIWQRRGSTGSFVSHVFLWLAVLTFLLSAAADLSAVAMLGPKWIALFLLVVIGAFFDFDTMSLIVWRRENPLRVLLDKLENEEQHMPNSGAASTVPHYPYNRNTFPVPTP